MNKNRYQVTNTQLVGLVLIAYIFSFAIRMIWVFQFQDNSSIYWDNEIMLNTNDGYWYAEGTRDIISGDQNKNDMSAYNTAGSVLTAFLVKYLPFNIETIIFYIPAFFASLIVIPIILIGRSIGKLEIGFIAALIGSIAWSYYNRTMVGYYDTDPLNIVLPTFFLWSLIWAINTQENKYLIITALDMIIYRWW